jgi:hypothetical protein
MRHPTIRKIRNRGWTPIRYWDGDQYRHGWIEERKPRGGMVIKLINAMGMPPTKRSLKATEVSDVLELA